MNQKYSAIENEKTKTNVMKSECHWLRWILARQTITSLEYFQASGGYNCRNTSRGYLRYNYQYSQRELKLHASSPRTFNLKFTSNSIYCRNIPVMSIEVPIQTPEPICMPPTQAVENSICSAVPLLSRLESVLH